MATDRPFAEVKEHLAGFYLVDCESIDRAVEHAARIPEAGFGLVEVRPIMDLSAPGHENNASGRGILRELAPQVLGALVRHYGGFDTCEDAVQEALLAAAVQGPNEGVPGNPKSWLITVASRLGEPSCGEMRQPADAGKRLSPRRRRRTLSPSRASTTH